MRGDHISGLTSEDIKILMNENNYSILFHCTEGKDRTGIVAMLILYVLDVDMDVIMEDYLFTNNVNQEKAENCFNMILESTHSEELANQVRDIFLAKESYLKSALESIMKEYGNLDNFMEERLDIEPSVRKKFKGNVLLKNSIHYRCWICPKCGNINYHKKVIN